MSWIPRILVGVGFLIWMGNKTCCSSTITTGGQPTGAVAGAGAGSGDDTDLTLALHEFLSHASANKIRNLNHFKTILKLRSPHRKKQHHAVAETMGAGDFMEALAEMGPNGKKVYSCTACGEECSITCGTRYFRTCCFHFSKKKKSSVPQPKKPKPKPDPERIKSVILHLLHKTSISNPTTFLNQDTFGNWHGYEDKDKDGRVSQGQGVSPPDSRSNNNNNKYSNNYYDDIKENTADYSSSYPRRIASMPISRGQKRSTPSSSYDENENDSLGLNVSCDIDALCDSDSSSSGWQRPGELPPEIYRDSDRI